MSLEARHDDGIRGLQTGDRPSAQEACGQAAEASWILYETFGIVPGVGTGSAGGEAWWSGIGESYSLGWASSHEHDGLWCPMRESIKEGTGLGCRAIGSWPTGSVCLYSSWRTAFRLCLPKAVKHWSLRSVQVKLIKMGGRLVRHSRWLIFQLSEVSDLDGPGSVGSYRTGYRRPSCMNHDLAKTWESAPGSGLSSMRFHRTGGGPKTTKTDKKRESVPG